MSQVTIYLEDDTLAAAKVAASRSQLSVSKWFAQFAVAEKAKLGNDRNYFWAEIDRLRDPKDDQAFDFLLVPGQRHADLPADHRLEQFDF